MPNQTFQNRNSELGNQGIGDRAQLSGAPLVVRPELPFEKPRVLIEWQAPLRVFVKRDFAWVVSLMVLTLVVMLPLILLKQWVLVLVAVSVAFVLYAMNRVEPEVVTYQIMTVGVKMGEKLYPYRDLRFFWIKKKKDQLVLYISTYLNFPHRLGMVVSKEERDPIEEFLLKYLPYHEEKEADYLEMLDSLVEILTPQLPRPLVDFSVRLFSLLHR